MPEYYRQGDWAVGCTQLTDGSKAYHVFNTLDAESGGATLYLINTVNLESAIRIIDCLCENAL